MAGNNIERNVKIITIAVFINGESACREANFEDPKKFERVRKNYM